MADSTVTSHKMTASLQKQFDKVFAQLHEDGLLLLSDPDLPSVSGIIAGERIRGSWWSHELGQTIFTVSEMIEDHKDVLITKLISRKVTFVHRELWNYIYSIGVARDDWQLKKLSADPHHSELEARLLIHAEQIHTESGKHAKIIETWDAWVKRVGFRPHRQDPVAARQFLEQRLADINKKYSGRGKLPWQ